MRSLTLYFLRHGQTALSRDNMFCGAGTNAGLTADGQEMAKQFATAYSHITWQAIFSSPLTRALHTIEPLSKIIKLAVEVRPELREIELGKWEGKTIPEVNAAFHEDYLQWSKNPATSAPTDGETAVEIAKRVRPLIESIRTRFQNGNILLVSHKATIRIALCDLLGIDLAHYRDRLACPVGSISVIEFGDRGPQLKVIADRHHLNARLRELPGT